MEITIVLRDNNNPLDELFDMIWVRSVNRGTGQIDLRQSTLMVDVSKLSKDAVSVILKATMYGVQQSWNLRSMVLFVNSAVVVSCSIHAGLETWSDDTPLMERLEQWAQSV